MGLYSHRQKETGDFADQRWEYINLADFHARGCGPGFAYFWLWLMLLVSISVYALDSFVAVNLLIFDQWSSKIEPGIPLNISKWIFSGCILLSFVNLAYEAFRAYRVMRRRNVAECYLDPLAVRWESIRMGSGQGYRRFLVFAALTKGKKGAEYVALFTYFSLKAWIRVLICSGPRQVINAFTFRDVYNSKLFVSEASVEGSITGFFEKVKALAEEDYQQALVLGSMAWTFIVWVFSVLFFIAAVLCYITFLCHWIPKSDGGLSGYCERKVNQALKKIVTQRVNKALAKGESNRFKEELKMAKKNGGEMPSLERMATLPTLPNLGPGPSPAPAPSYKSTEDSLPAMPMVEETTTPLPAHRSRPASPGGIELNNIAQRRMPLSRADTMASSHTNQSYSSDAPLLGSAAEIGQGRSGSPAPTVPDINLASLGARAPSTAPSSRGYGPPTTAGYMASDSASLGRIPMSQSPAPMLQGPGSGSMDSYGKEGGFGRPGTAPQQYTAYNPNGGRESPAPSNWNQQPTSTSRPYNPYRQNERSATAPQPDFHRGQGGIAPSQPPFRSATGPVPPRGPYQPPQRNLTGPVPARAPDGNFRSQTSQSMRAQPPQGFADHRSPTSHSMGPRPPQDQARSATPQTHRGDPYGYSAEAQRNQGYGY